MDQKALELIGVRYEDGLHRFADRPDLYEKYLIRFCNDPSFQSLRNAIDQKDYKNAFTYAHTLKGVSGNLSLGPLYEGICKLTEELRGIPDDKRTVDLFHQVEESYQSLVNVLR